MPHIRLTLAALLLAAPLLHAQGADKPPAGQDEPRESFQFILTLKITDQGKVTTDQTYTLTAINSTPGSFNFQSPSVRDGDRIPIAVNTDGDKTQIQYIDVGTNIDLRDLRKVGSLLAMHIEIENSAAIPNPEVKSDPIIRNTRYSISPAVPIGKQTSIYSSGDALNGHKVEIQLLAKPLQP
jgi:hypothetical protein